MRSRRWRRVVRSAVREALANGFPMTIDAGGGLEIECLAEEDRVQEPRTAEFLAKDLYALGGHIVNDATSREWMKDLPSLPDSLLRGKLKEAMDRGVQALPPDVREQVLKLPKTAEDKLQAELARTREKLASVAESSLSERSAESSPLSRGRNALCPERRSRCRVRTPSR